MKKLSILLSALIFSNLSFADHHALALEARQERTEIELTSISLAGDSTTINAEAQMGVYGRVYMTFILASSESGSGTYTFEGRGYVDEETVFSGTGVGIWNRESFLTCGYKPHPLRRPAPFSITFQTE